MKLRFTILLAVTAFLFSSCATTMTQRKTVDDLYYNPSEQTKYNFSEELNEDYRSILANDSLDDVDTTIYGNNEKSYESGYDRVLVDDYDEAYNKRRNAMNSPYYGMGNYYNVVFSDDYWYASSYDPMFYNLIIMGNNVWVEPNWMTSHFGYGYRYGRFYNSPYSYYDPFWSSPFYSGFGYRYGYGYGYGYHNFGYFGYGYHGGSYGGYYGGLYNYGYNPYYSSFDNYEFKRKSEQNLRTQPGTRITEQSSGERIARTRKLNETQTVQKSEGTSREGIRTRAGEETRADERTRTLRSASDQDRGERYIRRADERGADRSASTYNRAERVSDQQYNQRNSENTLSRYMEASDRERSSVVNHRYYERPANETRATSNVRNISRNSDGNNSTVRRRSTYTRPTNTGSSNRGSSSSTIRRSSSSSNNSKGSSSSGSSVSRSRGSSSTGSSSSTRSSSGSSGGRKRK